MSNSLIKASDNQLQPLPSPLHRSYRPLEQFHIGKQVKIITDLNVSILGNHSTRIKRPLVVRYYSVKSKHDKSWKLDGHCPRLLIENATFSISENARKRVVEKQSKEPHAFINGCLTSIPDCSDHREHERLTQTFLDNGARYINYCPYRTKVFVFTDDKRIPASKGECEALEVVPDGMRFYCFEDGILAV